MAWRLLQKVWKAFISKRRQRERLRRELESAAQLALFAESFSARFPQNQHIHAYALLFKQGKTHNVMQMLEAAEQELRERRSRDAGGMTTDEKWEHNYVLQKLPPLIVDLREWAVELEERLKQADEQRRRQLQKLLGGNGRQN